VYGVACTTRSSTAQVLASWPSVLCGWILPQLSGFVGGGAKFVEVYCKVMLLTHSSTAQVPLAKHCMPCALQESCRGASWELCVTVGDMQLLVFLVCQHAGCCSYGFVSCMAASMSR
jgi:hypothetical protein